MQGLVAWLAELAPHTIYICIGLGTFVENLFPPTPSDVAVALAGFLTQPGTVIPWVVWAAAWAGNLAGTLAVLLLSRRLGPRLIAGRLGRRLLPPDALVDLERDYLRFGAAGIFVSRFLPGFRSFVAPFVGLAGLPLGRALVPMALASAIWYGVLVWVGARVGAEWDAISQVLGQLNRGLALAALLVVILVGAWLWRRHRARPRRRFLALVRRALGEAEGSDRVDADMPTRAAAALLQELTHVDPAFTREEQQAIATVLRERWEGLGETRGAAPLAWAATVLGGHDLAVRIRLAERLYRVALSDGMLSHHEERLMGRVGELLGLDPSRLADARTRARS